MNCTLEEPCSKRIRTENGVAKHIIHDTSKKSIKVGSRRSQLALFQSNIVVDLLKKEHTGFSYEVIPMSTTGDKILDVALSKIGEKSLWTKELEVALEKKEVHIVVHSLKDLPTTLPCGMVIGAICKRENPCDVVIFKANTNCKDLKDLPDGSIVGTCSLRRIAQLKRLYPNLEFQSIAMRQSREYIDRGNVNSRFRKLDEDKIFSAIILAAAGVIRLDLADRIGQFLKPEECMYAVGQGALGVECKDDDFETLNLLSKISDHDTTLCCVAERAFMRKLEGGCSVPVAVNSIIKDKKLTLEGGVFSLNGSQSIIEKLSVELLTIENNKSKKHYVGIVASQVPHHLLNAAESLGIDLATLLLQKGANDILKEARENNANS